jgi:hypothetical protein
MRLQQLRRAVRRLRLVVRILVRQRHGLLPAQVLREELRFLQLLRALDQRFVLPSIELRLQRRSVLERMAQRSAVLPRSMQ